MALRGKALALGGVAVLAAFIAPALGAPGMGSAAMRTTIGPAIGYFTPAAADPKLSAIYGGSSAVRNKFRFTSAVADQNRSVTVAVRAMRLATPRTVSSDVGAASAPATASGARFEPGAYNLGASVGWKKFALQGDSARLESARLPARPDLGKVGAPAPASKWNTRVQMEAAPPAGQAPRTFAGENVSVDVAGSYRLTRNLDVTAGVRYRTDRDRLQRLPDTRGDNQAVYIGTAFRF